MTVGWIHYPLKFRLLSPLHVGHRRVGNLMQTKPYVPGKPLWAALTARLARDNSHTGVPGPKKYKEVGDALKENFRFGYLWPSLDGERPCFPWVFEGFDYTFLGSYVSTALDYTRAAADEGSLHEIEFLAPFTRDGLKVYLVGDLWVREGDLPEPLNRWREALGKIVLGGERNYGWGRVRLLSQFDKGRRDHGFTVTGFRWETRDTDGEVILQLPEESRLPAHALVADGRSFLPQGAIQGTVEALSGWQRKLDDSDKAWELMEVKLAYAPGGRVAAEGGLRFIVEPWGWLRFHG